MIFDKKQLCSIFQDEGVRKPAVLATVGSSACCPCPAELPCLVGELTPLDRPRTWPLPSAIFIQLTPTMATNRRSRGPRPVLFADLGALRAFTALFMLRRACGRFAGQGLGCPT